MEWYLKVLRQYADFSGRARRKEYWMFVLFNIILPLGGMFVLSFVFIVIESIISIDHRTGMSQAGYIISLIIGLIVILYFLAMIIPSLAVAVRRLHDTNQSGWMMLIGLIPVLGGIWLLISMTLNGDEGDNQYGPDPKRINHLPSKAYRNRRHEVPLRTGEKIDN
jgi:uncharacterized membrane protein YhaH (DUF805 family)